jgi:pyruvate formate lyase activating enzyme
LPPFFLSRIKSLGFLVKLDTNGSFFPALKGLVEKKMLDYVAMDIKNPPPATPKPQEFRAGARADRSKRSAFA